MKMCRFVGALVMVLIAVSCQATQRPPEAVDTSASGYSDRVQAVRQSYARSGGIVGRVVATLPQENLVAVEEMPLEQIREGDVVVLIDVNENVVGRGLVRQVTSHRLIVSYEKTGARPPQAGDLAVYLK